MKNSGIEWIGDIPNDWKISRYKFFASSRMGETILASDTSEEGLPIYSATQEGLVFGYIKSPKVVLKQGDLVIPARGNSIGCAMIVPDEVATCTQTTICSCFIHNCINKYLLYCCYGLKPWWFKYDGSAIPQITVQQVNNNYLPLPSINTQQRIAEFLDKKCAEVDAMIKNQEEQIEKLKTYKQAVITEAVTKGLDKSAPMKDSGVDWIGEIPEGWDMVRIKNLGQVRNGLTYSPNDLTDEDNGVLVLRSSNIQDGKLCFDDNVYVNCAVLDELMVKEGDILICSRNGSRKLIGKSALINGDVNATFGAFMMIFRSIANPKYMYYILNSNIFSFYLGTYLTSTINQLTVGNFSCMVIPFCPDIIIQNEIIGYLDEKCSSIDKLIELKQAKIDKLNEYKKSLIYEYVTGKKEVV